MTVIDLIPVDKHVRRAARLRLRAWSGRLGFGCLLGTILYVVLVQLAAAGQTDLRQLSGKYSMLQDRLRHAENLIRERDRLERHREAVGMIRDEQSAVWYLSALGEVLTPSSYLTSMELMLCVHGDPDEMAELACEPGLQLRGRAPDHQEVGQIIRRMFAAGIFGEVKLISISEPVKTDRKREVDFELVCTLDAAITDE